jgi:hypothetical protein
MSEDSVMHVNVERFEYTHRINDNGYDYEETVYKFRVVDNNGNVVDDNDGIGFFTEEEALDDLFETDEDMKTERDKYQEMEIPEDYDMDKLNKETEDFNKYMLKFSELEVYRYRQFEKEHRHKDVNKGAIGGHLEIRLTPTSLGTAKSVVCHICSTKDKEYEANITEYNW